MRSTFLSGSPANRRAKGRLHLRYSGSAAIAFVVLLALLAVGAFGLVGLSSAAGAVAPNVTIPQSPCISSCPSPSFGPDTNFPVGSNPWSVAVGDFNRDGNPDLAIANQASANVSVLLGNGNGGFGATTNFAVGIGPVSIAVGDFNRDSNPDLVTANAIYDNVSVLLGNGSGGFGAATNFAVGSFPLLSSSR